MKKNSAKNIKGRSFVPIIFLLTQFKSRNELAYFGEGDKVL
jgi:hypothetical protein